jgi:hypothetical protein
MRVLIAIAGALLVALMLSEFFVTFMLPRRVRRDPRFARGLDRLVWRRWRALARHLEPVSADTFLGFFGPLALLAQLVVWALGLMIGYGLIEWAVATRDLVGQATSHETQRGRRRGRIRRHPTASGER